MHVRHSLTYVIANHELCERSLAAIIGVGDASHSATKTVIRPNSGATRGARSTVGTQVIAIRHREN
jgi:hypothetical protein